PVSDKAPFGRSPLPSAPPLAWWSPIEGLIEPARRWSPDAEPGYVRVRDHVHFTKLPPDAEALVPAVTLPEWECPSCGATTRARLADHPEPRRVDKKIVEPGHPDWCYSHNAAEPLEPSDYSTCGECGHVFRTKQELINADLL